MTAVAATDRKNGVEKLLTKLRDVPVNTEGAPDSVLSPICHYLIGVPPGPDGVLHWFCNRADQVTIEAAAFLIRLHAYDSASIEQWKKGLESCLEGCCACIQGLEASKLSSRTTYFGAFPDNVLQGFYKSFDQWELKMVLNALSRSGLPSNTSLSVADRTLSDVPPTILYHIVSNLSILQDSHILSLIRSHPPRNPLSEWPTDPPPGLLILLMDESFEVRRWARSQIQKCTQVPIPKNRFLPAHGKALESIARALTSNSHNNTLSTSSALLTSPISSDASKLYKFASDPVDLWSGFCVAMRLIPPELLAPGTYHSADFRRIVTGHLHDIGPHFMDILRCLLFLLKRMGKDLWKGEGPEFAQIVLDAIKDNPSYSELLINMDPAGERPWFLSWFAEYLQSIQDPAVFSEILAKVVDFMCEELQHERFKEVRPIIMTAAARLLSGVFRKAHSEEIPHQRIYAASVLDIHAETFVAVAFARAYNDAKWSGARTSARDLIINALSRDVEEVSESFMQLCRLLAGRDTVVPAPSIRTQVWRKAYENLQTSDSDGISALIDVATRSAHLDLLSRKAFSPAFQKQIPQKDSVSAETAFNEINNSLATVRNGVLDALSKYANYNTSSTLLDLLRRPGMVKNIVVLMLSPVESLQVAAQTLVGQAFDVDVRLDCFRALLTNLSDVTLDGIFDFLETFVIHAPVVPEACSLSKSLVRCLTDVIEVLCSSHDGLLHNDQFLRPADKNGPASVLPKLWSLMAKSITVIFKRTPLWSTYFENEDMIVWMRDALIFGRDMLAQRRVIETAALVGPDGSTSQTVKRRKLSPLGKKMVNDLQDVLPELARWLRLTDEELLHQSFALLQSLLDCFRESQVSPSAAGIAKLQRHIDDARKKDPSRPQTRLDSTRLSKLEDALASFEGEDEIQILDTIPAPPPRRLGKDVIDTKATIRKRPSKQIPANSKLVAQKPPTMRHAAIARFTDHDQRKLDAEASMPTFRKASTSAQLKDSTFDGVIKATGGSKSEAKAAHVPVTELSSSSEESESEEESQRLGLSALHKFQRSPVVKKHTERRQVKVLDVPTNGRSAIQDRINRRDDARRITLRLKPNISDLHRTLLSWNYDHQGPELPPSAMKPQFTHIPDKFSDHHEYRRIFEPLLLLECWSQVVQSKEDAQDTYECKISSRQFIDDWLDLDISLSDVKRDWYLSETDVVLFRHLDGGKCILGKVQSYRSTLYGTQATVRCLSNGDPGPQISTTWKLSKVFSLSTLHREYAALLALPYYDLFETILQPHLPKISVRNRTEVQQAMTAYKVNEPQAVAILSSLQTEGFGLIQGPPGTGKTSTICGLVEAFLQRRPRLATAVNAGRNAGPMDKSPPKKVLLCAPSNAAIDEVAHRIKEGFRGPEQRGTPPKVVRVGADKSINISVKDISLDYLVDQKLNEDRKHPPRDAGSEIASLRGEIESAKRSKQQKQQELSTVHDNAARILALEDEIKKLNLRRMSLTQQVDRLRDQQKSDSRTLDATRRRFRSEVLQAADVICSTLSGAGHDILEQFDFEMVIIDEAAQAIELSSLIPLRYRCRRCIMVGDPQQLPPTVISQEACKYQYNQSLFVRLQKHRPDAVHLLSIQYRMHPDISQLPSRIFYQGRLRDGPDMDVKTVQPWHRHPKFGTYRFFNVSRGREEPGIGHSLKNTTECRIAVALYARLRREFSGVDLDFRIGVVSMYRAQIIELRRAFQQQFGSDIVSKVDFNTVDGFQGQEKDVIILSCVRAGPGLQTVGFLADIRRMNVAITRARSSLFILGNAPTLERSDVTWKGIVEDARKRAFLVDVDVTYFTSPVTATSFVPTPPRPKKSASLMPPVPMDLSTPHELKSTIERNSDSPATMKLKNEEMGSEQPSFSHGMAKVEAVEPISQNRRMDEDVVSKTSSLDKQPRPAKPRHPVAKRPKQAPNLFIPKSNKRPTPDNSEHGPSTNKRRL